MLKAEAQPSEPGEPERHVGTKRKIVEAALETLKREGFAGASARAIARTGDFNQALIFYHFGTVRDLLLAALDETGAVRMDRYRKALEGVDDLPSLLEVAEAVYREDLESGHIKVLAEMVVGASSVPGLGPEIVERIEPWVRFTEEAVGRVLDASPLRDLVPTRDLAFGIVSLYLGMEMLTHLDGDQGRAESLFRVAGNLTSVFGALLGGVDAGD